MFWKRKTKNVEKEMKELHQGKKPLDFPIQTDNFGPTMCKLAGLMENYNVHNV